MGRSPCCEKVGLKKGPWTPEEDQKLVAYIEQHGHGSWRALPAKAGLQRCGKSCRLRWTNYLRPDIKRGKFSLQEEQTIIQLHALLGNRWSAIAAQLPKRTDNEIKNYWNTHLKKRLARMGIDPTTHRPKTDALGGSADCSSSQSKDAANLSHMAQWESARLEAEARLVRESKLQVQSHQQPTQQPPPARLVLNKITAQPSFPPCLDVLKAWQNSWSSKPQSLPTTTTTKDNNNNKMHSMYAMMLSSDDTLLESPTSTLCFPGSNIMLPMVSTTTTTVGVVNENLLITPPLTNNVNGTTMMKGGSSNSGSESSSWGYLTKQNPEGAKHQGHSDENIERGVESNKLRDDDIMVAVEAFRSSAGGGGAYDTVDVPSLSTTSEAVAEEGLNHDAMAYESNDSLAIINGDGISMCDVSFEEENKHYWNAILNLVNDAQVMF